MGEVVSWCVVGNSVGRGCCNGDEILLRIFSFQEVEAK